MDFFFFFKTQIFFKNYLRCILKKIYPLQQQMRTTALVRTDCIGTDRLHWYRQTALVQTDCIGTDRLHWYRQTALVQTDCICTDRLHWYRQTAGKPSPHMQGTDRLHIFYQSTNKVIKLPSSTSRENKIKFSEKFGTFKVS